MLKDIIRIVLSMSIFIYTSILLDKLICMLYPNTYVDQYKGLRSPSFYRETIYMLVHFSTHVNSPLLGTNIIFQFKLIY